MWDVLVQCTPALGGLRSAMESWVTVGGGKKSTNAAGQGHRPSPLKGRLLGGMNRGQGGRSGADAPNNAATRYWRRRWCFPGFRPRRSFPPWRLDGLDGLADGLAGIGGPLPGGPALHWDNIPEIGRN